jgi:hypothetical protein
MLRVTRLALIAAFVMGSSVVSARADIQVLVYLHASANPSLYGQNVLFTSVIGNWCGDGSQPVIYLYDGAQPGPFGWAYLPNLRLGQTTSYFHTGTLSVGTHRLWGQAPRCVYQNTTFVSLQIAEFFQVVKPAPAAAPRANPPAPQARPRLPTGPKLAWRRSAAGPVGPQTKLVAFDKQASITAAPSPDGAVPIALLAVISAIVLGGLAYPWAARQRRRQVLRR